VVILDRSALDAVVYVRDRWAGGAALPVQTRLLARLAPRPGRAYLLDVSPETAYARKHDFPLDVLRARAALYRELHAALGVRRLDGEREPSDLCAEIAADVLDHLDQRR
jgi:thymidylate kinase